MATALIQGLVSSGHPVSQIAAADPYPPQLDKLAQLGIRTFEDNRAAITGADVVVLAVKPQVMAQVLAPLTFGAQTLLVSIAAGIPLAAISRRTGENQPLIRCMPNTPALVQAGITGLFANPATNVEQRALAEQILSAAGATVWVEQESELDRVTAVSGSGRAYFFYLMEALIKAGEELGLSTQTATQLTLATANGAAKMALNGEQSGDSPAVLRQNVTSPGGTTERALAIMDEHNTQANLIAAVTGAAQRAVELADELAEEFKA